MENSYGIGITNRYSCFLYSDDDTEEIRPQEDEREKKKKETGSTNVARKGIRETNQKGSSEQVKTGSRPNNVGNDAGNKPNRGPRTERPPYDKDRGVKFTEEEREERNNRRNREDAGRELRTDSEFGARTGSTLR
ncbi:unnamed protein product [Orchesella dallaii]|uniref:Uncharacterized protein n=1 Tax=Orchesella dallaii TaxID=48710 RepID=A0ABP1Q1W2_9HEXA